MVAVFAAFGSVVVARAAERNVPADPPRSIEGTVRTFETPLEDFDATSRPRSRAPIYVRGSAGDVLAYPPGRAASPDAPVVVYLHGRNGRAENGCPFMRSGPAGGWLVCPQANVKTRKGWSWTGKVKKDAPVVRNAIAATRSSAPRVVVGFSQGAYLAVDLLKKKKERFRGVVLLGASVNPSPKMLRSRGVERIVLGASMDEPWHDKLKKRVDELVEAGMDARFVSLGHVGHLYVGEDTDLLRSAIAWASSSPPGGMARVLDGA